MRKNEKEWKRMRTNENKWEQMRKKISESLRKNEKEKDKDKIEKMKQKKCFKPKQDSPSPVPHDIIFINQKKSLKSMKLRYLISNNSKAAQTLAKQSKTFSFKYGRAISKLRNSSNSILNCGNSLESTFSSLRFKLIS